MLAMCCEPWRCWPQHARRLRGSRCSRSQGGAGPHWPRCWQCAQSHGDVGLNMPDVFEALCAAVTETVQDLIVQDVGHVL